MSSKELALPISVNPQTWNADTAAMMEFAGLTWIEKQGEQDLRVFAPSGIMAGFIGACNRTGLDPTAKQIYAAVIGGKWTILIGVDGMRVVAQRTGEYDGQDPIEWQTEDNGEWTTVPPKTPFAARIRIYRKGIGRPLEQTVTMAEFSGRGGNWNTRPSHMLGIRAETHGFRRLFPMQLSGLYTAEDFEADGVDTSDAITVEPTQDWAALINDAETREQIQHVVSEAKEANELTDAIRTAALTRYGMFNRAEAQPAPDRDEDAVADEARRAFEETPDE
ncbi:recombinase RecT [Paramicrobacterium chengjingii]|uniref:recombinase RecT n=1 Tax=Paramicrobacterium chengjingii TaxID=2769067 RepID=UPI001424825B|nr:recombinase RecT [Microbacterium chengjingii]